MFERIKCYKNLRIADEYLRGMKCLGVITGDEELIKEANNALYSNAIIKKRIWRNRKMAETYNLELIRNGLC